MHACTSACTELMPEAKLLPSAALQDGMWPLASCLGSTSKQATTSVLNPSTCTAVTHNRDAPPPEKNPSSDACVRQRSRPSDFMLVSAPYAKAHGSTAETSCAVRLESEGFQSTSKSNSLLFCCHKVAVAGG